MSGINAGIRGHYPEEDLLGDLMAKVAAGEGTEEDAQLPDDALIFAQAEARRFRNPEAAVRVLDRSAIQRNEAGIPTNLGSWSRTYAALTRSWPSPEPAPTPELAATPPRSPTGTAT